MRNGYVLDSGALIALEKPAPQRRLNSLLGEVDPGGQIVISAGSLAEVWRGSARQAPLALLIRRSDTIVVEITIPVAKAIGVFLATRIRGNDLVDAHVAMLARQFGFAVITSNSSNLKALDPTLRLFAI